MRILATRDNFMYLVICFRITPITKFSGKNSSLSLIFMLFFKALLNTIRNFKFWPLEAPTRFPFPSNKIFLKKFEAVLQPQTVVTHKRRKNIVKSIHSSFHSEFKYCITVQLYGTRIDFFSEYGGIGLWMCQMHSTSLTVFDI